VRRPTTAAILLSLGLVASACGGSSSGSSGADVASDAGAGTEFTGTTIDGQQLALADYAGDDVLLWFWAPW
jgi:hypothetical protein